jgi:hypothetical protein
MNPVASGGHPLRYFIHDDFDALRIELSRGLVGRAVQKAYEAWRSASLLGRRARLVVDISYVTEAEHGKTVLRTWHERKARIVASSPASRAIADSVLDAPVPLPAGRSSAVWVSFSAGQLPEIRQAPKAPGFRRQTQNSQTLRILDFH